MVVWWVTNRTISYEPAAQVVLDSFSNPHDRFQDQLMGLEWLLSRTPQVGVPATSDEKERFLLLVSKGDEAAGLGDIWILYSYDENVVTVHGFNLVHV